MNPGWTQGRSPAMIAKIRQTALVCYASGRTSASLRRSAASDAAVAAISEWCAGTPARIRGQMLTLADAIDELAGEGLTRERARARLGWTAVPGSPDGAR